MTLIYFILVLGIIVLVHEFGHFIFARRAKIHVYEFSIGMGPTVIKSKPDKYGTIYSIRLIPIGGAVMLAGEGGEEDSKISKDKTIQGKSWSARFLTMVAGAMFNFIFALLVLFAIGLFWGSPETKPYVMIAGTNLPAYKEGIRDGDLILEVNGKKVKSWDELLLELELVDKGSEIVFKVKTNNENIKDVSVTPEKYKDENGIESYKYGISSPSKKKYGFMNSLSYALNKFVSLIKTMWTVIKSLVTGGLGLGSMSGPIGIYNVIGSQASRGFDNILYLMAFISINVGFINLLPIPAFDGGRVLFLVIEKIIGRPVNENVENMIHNIGFFLLMGLMIIITFNDVIKLF